METSRRNLLKKTALVLPTLMTFHISKLSANVSGAPNHNNGNHYGDNRNPDYNPNDNAPWNGGDNPNANGGSGKKGKKK